MLFSSHHQRVLLMPGCPEPVLAGLQRPGRLLLRWTEPELAGWTGYGEALVAELSLRLVNDQIDLLVTPAPSDCGEPARSRSLAGMEAARRLGKVDVACVVSTSCSEQTGVCDLQGPIVTAGRLFEVMLDAVLAPPLPSRPPLLTTTSDPKLPRVSVVVRSMDRSSLAASLATVSLQTYRPIEIVVVNALGKAHGPVPVGRALDLEVVEVAEPSGGGLLRAAAANAGLDRASGELLLFLDDDDLLLPDHLARLVAALAAHPEAPAAYADVESGTTVGDAWRVDHRFAADFDSIRLLFENYLPIHSVLFRRRLLQQSCRVDESFDLFEDWDFWLQLAQIGPFVRVPGVSARYLAPHAAGHSAVFEDSPAARAARERLVDKWRHRQSPQMYAQALNRLRALFRRLGQLQAELEDLQRGHAEQAAVLQAREAELTGFAPLLAAREAEIGSARIELEAQQVLRAAREQELANALAAVEAQREVLTHREREVSEGAQYTHSLQQTLAHREREITDFTRQMTDLRAALESRQSALDQRMIELAQRDAELAALHAEKPLQALARTLRRNNRPHGPCS